MKSISKRAISLALALILALAYAPCVFAYLTESAPQLDDPAHKFLADYAVLGYKYNPEQDYYYCDSPNSWQKQFGYTRIYDLVAPYVLLEYDYARVHFEYEGKDWLVQFWKGQYGLMFYGSEVGVYTKEHTGEEDSYTTHYDCAAEEDWLSIQTVMYHDEKGNGEYKKCLETPYEETWWSTGFKRGHLRVQEPARELRQEGVITLKSPEMAEAFAAAFEQCGFKRAETAEGLELDSFFVDGAHVLYRWQNNSEAENTMPIKVATGTMLFMNMGIVMTLILAVLGGMFAMGLLAFIIL
ncbi:MAG: DUF4474 domain-containing protein [Clostridia bacterium]|nr:DUF4474 domain-containing protein [Clostridia bacterium]MBR6360795.1 DUF4474 domain-containing protein [Clostridia bacterium]